ncbi:MAG: hypothetical protein J2P37_33765 [Ktedonobacteraceae bacterium]|nr:hypothetical protein [Ktedonobacteraceae bacterium]MBO0796827.1 hypothetical protein [Ktedonobacteraceae bacterium]
MSSFLWTLGSIVGYIAGLVIILLMTPRLVRLSFDEGLFMGMAALEILGALLVFGAVAVTFGAFSGAIGVRILDFVFLGGIVLVGIRGAWSGVHPGFVRTSYRASRAGVIIFCLCLVLAALYYIVQLFQ